jgi:hypothetical protein
MEEKSSISLKMEKQEAFYAQETWDENSFVKLTFPFVENKSQKHRRIKEKILITKTLAC